MPFGRVGAQADAFAGGGLASNAWSGTDLGDRVIVRIEAIAAAQTLNREYIETWARYLDRWAFVSRALAGEGLEAEDLD